MRVAVISDIHGNALALDAVLADLSGEAIDQGVCLGDAVQGGAQPAETVARLRELGWPVVIGNADAWLLTGEETGDEGTATPWMLAVREWSLGQLSEEDRRYIVGFRPTVEFALPGGRGLLCAHGTPRSFDDIIVPETPDAEVVEMIGPVGNAIVCGGHTHTQQLRHLGESFFFNPGSVSLPFRRALAESPPRVGRWAEYAVLTAEEDGGVRIEFRRVAYDVERSVAAILGSGMPEAERLAGRYRV
ncbi:MAG TPA: metallophosphoesterase family protein [Thermomicrobiales bacterium]|nr:metallophosphoesterase family protein [Thermomicrobiales bacterium]